MSVMVVLANGCCNRMSVAAFGAFYAYAPESLNMPSIVYHGNQTPVDLLDQHFSDSHVYGGNDYTIADMAIWAWYGPVSTGQIV